jgi:hypothetical protein
MGETAGRNDIGVSYLYIPWQAVLFSLFSEFLDVASTWGYLNWKPLPSRELPTLRLTRKTEREAIRCLPPFSLVILRRLFGALGHRRTRTAIVNVAVGLQRIYDRRSSTLSGSFSAGLERRREILIRPPRDYKALLARFLHGAAAF